MSILCSSDVYARLELLIHGARCGELCKIEAEKRLLEIVENAEDGDMLSVAIRSVLEA